MTTPSTPPNRPQSLFRHRVLTSPTSPKPQASTFQTFEKSCTRTEMPSKYKIVPIPKVHIEDVWSQRTNTNRSDKDDVAVDPVSPQSSTRGFYYSEKNEILSMDAFLQVHKKLEMFRKRSDKASARLKLDERAFKIDEMKGSSVNLLEKIIPIRSQDTTINPDRSSSRRPQTGNLVLGSRDEMSKKNSRVFYSRRETSVTSPNMRRATSANTSVRQPPTLRITNQKTELNQVEELTSAGKQNPPKSMAAQQKFTAKEINRHLLYMTVSPKRPKLFPNAITKELNYCKMFSSPKVMDLAVESCIKKGKKLEAEQNHEVDHDKKYELGFNSSRSFTKEDELGDTYASAFMTQTQTSPFSRRQEKKNPLSFRIEERIHSIDTTLKRGLLSPSVEKMEASKKAQPVTVRTKNKVPLRTSFKNSHHIKDIIQEHRALAAKIKNLNATYKKEYGASGMNSQTYSFYYH